MSEFFITYRGTVYPWQCDHMGHMNVMWYTGKFDEASWQLLSLIGLNATRFRNDGTGMAAIEQHINYKRELHPGDAVTIRSAFMEIKDKSVRFIHEMSNDETGAVAATSVLVAVHLDSTVRKALPLPADVRERAGHLVGENSDNNRRAFLQLIATISDSESCNPAASGVGCFTNQDHNHAVSPHLNRAARARRQAVFQR